MKTTLTESTFIREFIAVRPDQFSVPALRALFEYYREAEESTGEEMEFDPIAICCDWTEYASATEAAEAYGWECPESEDEKNDLSDREALQYLHDETTVLELSSGLLVLNY
jgi:hypothetical protein